MTAEIIKLRPGNGAREAMIKMFASPVFADWLLAVMWEAGFKVVPLEPKDEC